jgi:hypothetical protein
MSRSRRHHPVIGMCTGSDTAAKRSAARRLRHINRARLAHDPDAVLAHPFEVDDRWYWPRDGRQRLDPVQWPFVLRK